MIIGVTGGIGSGKSFVSKMLAKYLETEVISADAVSINLTVKNGEAIPQIIKCFGADMIDKDGAMDRKKMRELVFQNPEKKKELESLLSPLINKNLEKEIKEVLSQSSFAVVEIPLLYETKEWVGKCDCIVAVDCSEDTQVRRVKARNGLGEAEIKAIMKTQATSEQRRSIATHVIINDNEVAGELEKKIVALAIQLLGTKV